MTKEELTRKLKELPEPVSEHLYSDEIGELNGSIIDRNGLDDVQQQTFYDLIDEVFVRAVPISNLQSEIEKRFGFSKEKARNLALDIAGYRLLPFDKWLGDVSGYIRQLNGDINAFPKERVQLTMRTPEEAASDLVKSIGSPDWDQHDLARLKDIAHSFFKGVRTEAQALEALQRPEKIGGMGLSPSEAASIIDELKEEARATLIAEKKEEEPLVASTTVTVPKKISSDSFSDADAAEVASHQEGILATKTAEQSAVTAGKIKNSVEKIYAATGLTIPDEKLQQRLRDVIGARLRDVRDALETLEVLVQPKELGGLSLSQDDARRVLKLIDDSLRTVREEHQKQVDAEKTTWLGNEAQKKLSANEAAKTEDVAQLDTLYQSIVAKSAKAQAKAPAPTPRPQAAEVVVAAPVAPRPPLTPAEKLVPPNLPIVGAPPAPVVVPMSPPQTSNIKPQTLPPPITLVRPAPQMAASPSVRPIMHDVKDMGGGAGVKLTGPAEELRTTTIVDFRRLSKDPVVACEKIKDKVDLLHQQGYEKRTEGLVAWNASEVYRTYIQMMKEALDGKPMVQVISDRGNAKQPFLTAEEMKAVADLSRKLRY